MKSFKEYLVENKQTYEFKVKVAGECPKDCASKIKEALSKFNVQSCSSGKSTPIQETQVDFPTHKNVEVTIFDVCTEYPATSLEVRDLVAEHCNILLSAIKVRNLKEQEEVEINHANDQASGESLLKKSELEATDGQSLVGDKQRMTLLKELGKNKTQGTQYKGVNDKILAKKLPSEKLTKVDKLPATKSPISGKGK